MAFSKPKLPQTCNHTPQLTQTTYNSQPPAAQMDTIMPPHLPVAHRTVTIANKTHINDELGKYIQADSAFVKQFGLEKIIQSQQG